MVISSFGGPWRDECLRVKSTAVEEGLNIYMHPFHSWILNVLWTRILSKLLLCRHLLAFICANDEPSRWEAVWFGGTDNRSGIASVKMVDVFRWIVLTGGLPKEASSTTTR